MTMNLNRRIFLRGLGGAAVAAPFLSSVAERAAKAQGVAATDPKRLIVMFNHYGCITDRWFPTNSHGALTADDYMGLSIEPLAPYADKLLVARGIRAMNEWRSDMTTGQGNDPHTQVVGSAFTCTPVTPHSGTPYDFDAAKKFNAKATGPSLDHVCAKQLSPQGVPLFMRVGGRADSPQSGISYSAALEPFAGIGAPLEAYANLTGLFMTGGGEMTPDTYKALAGSSVLDLVKDDLETLERFDMSMSDRDKLEQWKALLDDTGRVVGPSASCNEEQALALGLSQSNMTDAGGTGFGGDISTKIDGDMDAADVYSNIAVLAALCDANRVIFLKFPAAYVYGGIGINADSHGISHRIGDPGMGGACVANVNTDLLTMDKFHAEKFAYLVKQLDSINEGDGTLLDNCAAVWTNELSDGNAHNLNNMPIIVAGSCGGYFKTGQAVNVDGGASDLDRGNSYGPCDGGGQIPTNNVTITGSSPSIANAPINKFYCNLMNAIGVKADASGFPTEGGTEEVTHFGTFDDSSDFVNADTNPARITDPGAFEDLKANA
jgi:hypothetical protein